MVECKGWLWRSAEGSVGKCVGVWGEVKKDVRKCVEVSHSK